MQVAPFPPIHTAANARAGAVRHEAAVLRAEADAILAAIDDLCGHAHPKVRAGVSPSARGRNAA